MTRLVPSTVFDFLIFSSIVISVVLDHFFLFSLTLQLVLEGNDRVSNPVLHSRDFFQLWLSTGTVVLRWVIVSAFDCLQAPNRVRVLLWLFLFAMRVFVRKLFLLLLWSSDTVLFWYHRGDDIKLQIDYVSLLDVLWAFPFRIEGALFAILSAVVILSRKHHTFFNRGSGTRVWRDLKTYSCVLLHLLKIRLWGHLH